MIKRALAILLILSGPALADAPQIQNVNMARSGDTWTFDVTILHSDSGWDHYVDAWRIVDAAGNTLGTRDLAHPHIDEQPFTRSLSGVRIPGDVTDIGVQAHDTTTGWGEIRSIKLR